MSHQLPFNRLLGATALALAFSTSLHAAGTSTGNASSGSETRATQSTGTTGATGKTSTTGTTSTGTDASVTSSGSSSVGKAAGSGGANISAEDKEFMEDIAHANLAEIETGKLALEKSQKPEVKKFAQKMIDDHTKAMKELQKLAQSKGVELPKETDIQHKTIATALKILSGDTFDSQYISRVGVGDHERTLGLLEETQKNAKDPALKAYAQKTLKVVKEHLQSAQKMEHKK